MRLWGRLKKDQRRPQRARWKSCPFVSPEDEAQQSFPQQVRVTSHSCYSRHFSASFLCLVTGNPRSPVSITRQPELFLDLFLMTSPGNCRNALIWQLSSLSAVPKYILQTGQQPCVSFPSDFQPSPFFFLIFFCCVFSASCS